MEGQAPGQENNTYSVEWPVPKWKHKSILGYAPLPHIADLQVARPPKAIASQKPSGG